MRKSPAAHEHGGGGRAILNAATSLTGTVQRGSGKRWTSLPVLMSPTATMQTTPALLSAPELPTSQVRRTRPPSPRHHDPSPALPYRERPRDRRGASGRPAPRQSHRSPSNPS